jgi:transposase
VRWPVRQRPGEREPEARERLERRFTDSPTLDAASHLREALTDLCDRDDTKAGAKRAIRAWCQRVRQRGLAACARVLGTLARWMAAITHDFSGRQTSGVVEGFNNRVKVLTRRCSGICTVGTLFPRLTRDWHGDQRFGPP